MHILQCVGGRGLRAPPLQSSSRERMQHKSTIGNAISTPSTPKNKVGTTPSTHIIGTTAECPIAASTKLLHWEALAQMSLSLMVVCSTFSKTRHNAPIQNCVVHNLLSSSRHSNGGPSFIYFRSRDRWPTHRAGPRNHTSLRSKRTVATGLHSRNRAGTYKTLR